MAEAINNSQVTEERENQRSVNPDHAEGQSWDMLPKRSDIEAGISQRLFSDSETQ